MLRSRDRWTAPAIILLAAVAIRCVQFGNPVIHVDEQYYLLVGERMWTGALPYVDYWDRKPIGLFLIYAACRALPGDGVLAYQLVATGFAAATAWTIGRLANRFAPPPAALAAALVYLVALMANGGDGGQAPVFYNLPVALAALACVRASEGREPLLRGGATAMLLLGLAIQVKYTVVFEGAFLGVALLAIAWRRQMSVARLAALAAAWVALALLPTVLALTYYTARGEASAFLFANFVSIFHRSPSIAGDAAPRLARIALHVAPLLLAAFVALAQWRHWRGTRESRWIVTGWAAASIAGVLVFGTYHDHYALPVLVPLAVVAAPAFAMARLGHVIAVVTAVPLAVMATMTIADRRAARGTGAEVRAISARIGRCADCLYVFSGDPILYLMTGAVPPTRFSFPTFLSETRDAPTLGIDPAAEVERIMRGRPRFVVTRDFPFAEAEPSLWQVMRRHLSVDYEPVLSARLRGRTILLYRRRDQSVVASAKP